MLAALGDIIEALEDAIKLAEDEGEEEVAGGLTQAQTDIIRLRGLVMRK